jgi:hypothetical protein
MSFMSMRGFLDLEPVEETPGEIRGRPLNKP